MQSAGEADSNLIGAGYFVPNYCVICVPAGSNSAAVAG
jgi:hypothetical protein